MVRSSPQQLAERYGADATETAFEKAKHAKARDHTIFATTWLKERYGEGETNPGKKRKVLCDGCSRPRWIDDMAVQANEARCPGCVTPPLSAERPFIYTLTYMTKPTPAARKVQAYWEHAS